jgi:hypothetical protein
MAAIKPVGIWLSEIFFLGMNIERLANEAVYQTSAANDNELRFGGIGLERRTGRPL